MDERDSGKLVHIRVNDELYIRLPETPSTGYIWTVDTPDIIDLRNTAPEQSPDGEACLGLVEEKFEPTTHSEKLRVGAGGQRRFMFRSLRPGRQTLRLINRRPWQRSINQIRRFEISLDITSKDIQGLSELQHESLLVGV